MYNYSLLRLWLCVVVVMVSALLLEAQPQVLRIANRDTSLAKGKKIPARRLDTLFNTAEAALRLYNERASMIDIATQKVSGRSTSAFRDMFVPNSSVYNDVGKDSSSISASDYAGQAYQFLRNTGIKIELQDARFEQVSYDSAGFYLVGIRVVKLLSQVLDAKNNLVSMGDCPRKVSLLLRFEIDKKSKLLAARIIDIRGRVLPGCPPSSLTAQPVIGFGPGIFMTQSNPQFQNRLGSEQALKTKLNSATYFGLHYLRPLSPKKPLLLGAALGFSSQSLESQTDTFLSNIIVKNNTKLQVYEFKEAGKLSGIDLALGIGYQKKLKKPLAIGIMLWAVGTLPINNQAIQNYQLSYRTTNAIKQPYKQLADSSSVVFNQSQLRFGARLSPFINYMFNKQMGIQLECNYHLMLNNVYPVVAEDEDFFDQYESLREQKTNMAGAISTAFEAVKFNSFGFRLALTYTIAK